MFPADGGAETFLIMSAPAGFRAHDPGGSSDIKNIDNKAKSGALFRPPHVGFIFGRRRPRFVGRTTATSPNKKMAHPGSPEVGFGYELIASKV